MNYEELYAELSELEKNLKESSNLIARLYKSIAKDTESGNIRNIQKSLELLKEAGKNLQERTDLTKACVNRFDSAAYFNDGTFAEQMLEACREAEVDVIGEFPVYEMFPYKVRIDAENQEVYLDRKKLPTMRPQTVANTVKAGKEKLLKAKFNAVKFADELAEAYDLTLLKMGKRPGADLYLTNVYKVMVPMGRFRRDYDQQSFAFDIARLYTSDEESTKKGRRWQFGPARNNGKAIRILDSEGNEQFLATIKFFDAE